MLRFGLVCLVGVSFVFVSSSAGLENTSTQKFVNFGAPTHTGNLLNHATESVVANLRDAINAATVAGDLNVSASRDGVGTATKGQRRTRARAPTKT